MSSYQSRVYFSGKVATSMHEAELAADREAERRNAERVAEWRKSERVKLAAMRKSERVAIQVAMRVAMRESDRAYMAAIREADRVANEQRTCERAAEHARRKYEERLAKVKASALLCETRSDFKRLCSADYGWAYARGVLDQGMCDHMRPRWSRMICYHM